jgi:hypothetical protein
VYKGGNSAKRHVACIWNDAVIFRTCSCNQRDSIL